MFSKESFDPLKSHISDSLTVFSSLLTFLKNYTPKSEIFVSKDRTGCGNVFCINGYGLIFSHGKLCLRKVKYTIFGPFLETFDFSRKLSFQILGFGFNESKLLKKI